MIFEQSSSPTTGNLAPVLSVRNALQYVPSQDLPAALRAVFFTLRTLLPPAPPSEIAHLSVSMRGSLPYTVTEQGASISRQRAHGASGEIAITSTRRDRTFAHSEFVTLKRNDPTGAHPAALTARA